MAFSPQQVEEIFHNALAKPPADREGYILAAAGGDTALVARVRSLLASHEAAGEAFLPLPAAAGPIGEAAGSNIGPYKLLQQIGEGGFGAVFMAEQESPVRRRVALKVIKAGMDTRQVIARFEAERQALAMMDHPNVARVFDAGATPAGRPYFVMELVRGVPITQFCDEQNQSIPQRLELFIQVCQAVQHAHQKGLIHRDLKPSNVLVSTQDGRPAAKIIDFGIAKATESRLTEKTLFTEFQQMVGTPSYMSPEHAGGSFDIDTRSDVYSLGVLLYELLTGATPFDAKELRSKAYGEIQRIIREVDPPTPSTRLSRLEALPSVAASRSTEPRKLGAALRGELDWIVMKCLEKDRARRYASAAGLADDLAHHMANQPVSAGPPSRWYRARKFVRRNRLAVLSGVGFVLLLLAGIVGTTLGLLEARRQRDEANLQRQQADEFAQMAEAVSKFQADMLQSADPSRLLGDKVTVLQAVTAAVKQLDEGALGDKPKVEANVRFTIGDTLSALGRYDAAAPNFERALDLRRAAFPSGHPGIALTLWRLGLNLQNQGRLTEAEAAFREALSIYQQATPADGPTIAAALAHVAETLRMQGRLAEAEPLAREALGLVRRSPESKDSDIDGMASSLGLLLRAQRKFDEAEPLLREAVDLRRRRLPADHPDLAKAYGNLATLLTDQKKFTDAAQNYAEVLRIQRKTLPAGHPDIGKTLLNIGWVEIDLDRPTEGEALFRESAEILSAAIGAEHWITASARRGRGTALTTLKRFPEAEAELLAAERATAKSQGASQDRHVRCVRALVTLYDAWDAAEPRQGHEKSAAEWRTKLPTTAPAGP